MATDLLAPVVGAPLAIALRLDEEGSRRLRDAFFAGRGANTLRAYRSSLADFAAFVGRRLGAQVLEDDALQRLLLAGQGGANLLAHEWRADMLARKLAPGTVALRLSALKSAVTLARTLGMVPWQLDVARVKVEAYRDTAGPGLDGVQRIADSARARTDTIGARDRALLALLFLQGLRRAEAVSLDVEHVDLPGRRLMVLGKGRSERKAVHVAPDAAETLRAWLEVRPGEAAGPLLFGWSAVTHQATGRLTGRGVAHIIGRYGRKVLGSKVRPHGLRHAAATALLDSGMTWAEVAGFTRHKDPSTLRFYDDNRGQRGARAAVKLSELVKL